MLENGFAFNMPHISVLSEGKDQFQFALDYIERIGLHWVLLVHNNTTIIRKQSLTSNVSSVSIRVKE